MRKKLGRMQRAIILEAARRWLVETRFLCGNCAEARRAFMSGNNTKTMTGIWTGVGTQSDYQTVVNAGLMTWVNFRHGSTMWWRMTETGANLVQSWIHAGLHLGHFDGYEPTYHVDSIIESCVYKAKGRNHVHDNILESDKHKLWKECVRQTAWYRHLRHTGRSQCSSLYDDCCQKS